MRAFFSRIKGMIIYPYTTLVTIINQCMYYLHLQLVAKHVTNEVCNLLFPKLCC